MLHILPSSKSSFTKSTLLIISDVDWRRANDFFPLNIIIRRGWIAFMSSIVVGSDAFNVASLISFAFFVAQKDIFVST